MRHLPRFVSVLALLAVVVPAYADGTDDFLVFPGVIRTQRPNLDPTSTQAALEFTPFADFFYSANFGADGRFRFLAEDVITSSTHEIQRLQLGWQLDPNLVVWLGRYHTPVGYWNTEYHHGQYLQTAITRPALVSFEGANGILPTHFTGLLVEYMNRLEAGGGIEYTLAVGATATIEGRLRPLDVFDPQRSDNGLGIALRIAFQGDVLADDQIGLFLGHSTFDAMGMPGLESIEQLAVGAFANRRFGELRLISELVRFDNRIRGPSGGSSSAFHSLYLQGEYRLLHQLTAFGRAEWTERARTDPFLQLLPDFIGERQIVGLRFDFKRWQALTLEVAHRTNMSEVFDEVLVQWSAVIP